MRAAILAVGLALAMACPAAAQKGADAPAPSEPSDPVAFVPTPAILASPVWLERPDARDFSRYIPVRAMEDGVSGRVVLDCIVDGEGLLGCSVYSHEPEGYGFDQAGLRIARHFRMALTTRDGRLTQAGRVRVPIRFVVPERYDPPTSER